MRIFRYLDQAGAMGFGRFDEQGQTFRILKKDDGDFEVTDDRITPFQLLTPIDLTNFDRTADSIPTQAAMRRAFAS